MSYSENATTETDQQGQQCPVNPQSTPPVSTITESPCAMNTGNLTTANDLPGLVTHNEIRYCQYCKADTPHRVGLHKQFVDRPNYTQDLEIEYSHCECGNTATETIKKITVMKGGE